MRDEEYSLITELDLKEIEKYIGNRREILIGKLNDG